MANAYDVNLFTINGTLDDIGLVNQYGLSRKVAGLPKHANALSK